MPKLFFILFICVLAYSSNAQAQRRDSLKAMLANVTNPREKFDIIRTYLEHFSATGANNIDSASCIELLKIAQQEKNDSMLAISYNWIGDYFSFTKGDNITALEYFFKALPLTENTKNKRRISSLYFDIAMAYYDLHNYEEGFKNIKKGGENLPDETSPLYDFMLFQYQRGMCIYYNSIHQADSALHYAQLMNETSRKVKSNNFVFSSLFITGKAYLENGDIEMAEIYFKRANAMLDSVEMVALKSNFYQSYIRFLLRNKGIEETKQASKKALDLAEKNTNNTLKLEVAGFLRQVYDSLHKTDSAYYYSRIQVETNAILFNQNNINKLQALTFNEQIRNIEEEAKKKHSEEERRQNIQYAIIALGIVIFIVLFLLFSRSIMANQKLISFFGVLGLLIVFEFINLLIHPWLASFTHESPVLMLLTLVVIASLLIPLHHRLEKWIKEKMTEKNNRIRLEAAKKTIEKLEKSSLKTRSN